MKEGGKKEWIPYLLFMIFMASLCGSQIYNCLQKYGKEEVIQTTKVTARRTARMPFLTICSVPAWDYPESTKGKEHANKTNWEKLCPRDVEDPIACLRNQTFDLTDFVEEKYVYGSDGEKVPGKIKVEDSSYFNFLSGKWRVKAIENVTY